MTGVLGPAGARGICTEVAFMLSEIARSVFATGEGTFGVRVRGLDTEAEIGRAHV